MFKHVTLLLLVRCMPFDVVLSSINCHFKAVMAELPLKLYTRDIAIVTIVNVFLTVQSCHAGRVSCTLQRIR